MRKLAAVLLVSVCCGVSMFGQTDKGEFFAGYSLERIAAGCGTDYRCGVNNGATTNLNGWIVSLDRYFYRSLGVSAQFSGNYGSAGFAGGGGGLATIHRYAYQFGPVYTFRWQRANAFAHALFGGVSQGAAQSDNGTVPGYNAFLWSVGGGLDVKLSKALSIRAAQIDYERHHLPATAFNGETTPATNGIRYSAGVVLRF